MNDLQLYQYYLSIPLSKIGNRTRIYPKYVKITGRSFMPPHPHRHFSFEEFIDKLYEDTDFKNIIYNSAHNIL